jgi:hypothetical protein
MDYLHVPRMKTRPLDVFPSVIVRSPSPALPRRGPIAASALTPPPKAFFTRSLRMRPAVRRLRSSGDRDGNREHQAGFERLQLVGLRASDGAICRIASRGPAGESAVS